MGINLVTSAFSSSCLCLFRVRLHGFELVGELGVFGPKFVIFLAEVGDLGLLLLELGVFFNDDLLKNQQIFKLTYLFHLHQLLVQLLNFLLKHVLVDVGLLVLTRC